MVRWLVSLQWSQQKLDQQADDALENQNKHDLGISHQLFMLGTLKNDVLWIMEDVLGVLKEGGELD